MRYKYSIYLDFYNKYKEARVVKEDSFKIYFYKHKRDLIKLKDYLCREKNKGYNIPGYRKYNKEKVKEYFKEYGAKETSVKLGVPLKTIYRYIKE